VEYLHEVHVSAIHFVEENQVGDGPLVEEVEQRREAEYPIDHRFADHHDGLDADQGVVSFLDKFDRVGAIEKTSANIFVFKTGGVDFDGHLPIAGFGVGVTDGIVIGDPTFAGDRAGDREEAFEQGGFTTEIGSHDRNASGTR
jgi:hypothetical protein